MRRSRDESCHVTTATLWRFRTSVACTTATNGAPRSTHSSPSSLCAIRDAEERRDRVYHLSNVFLDYVKVRRGLRCLDKYPGVQLSTKEQQAGMDAD
jgi:hypothetical protein